LAAGTAVGCFPFRHDVERFQGVADQIEGSLHLTVPQASANMLVDDIREAGAFLAIFGGGAGQPLTAWATC
jgi:hypothetical protein